jgi:transcription termination factor NusB
MPSYLDAQVRLYEDKISKYDTEIDKYIQKAAIKRIETVFKRTLKI